LERSIAVAIGGISLKALVYVPAAGSCLAGAVTPAGFRDLRNVFCLLALFAEKASPASKWRLLKPLFNAGKNKHLL
jgi:hypothetical protein